ncbi:penicillin-binding protein C [Enterococcus haemoperoxidus ATCC BAA-382]|uniref:Penicillin-binding protein C n=1 Tax=Enterococcus haemoperoxidus ATCC BAA-382 TaxID=1158608 RepID=R2QAP2_9ENTE|nr:penicillin-binding protein 2 [Enterococcus haemoperoxidus]EOH93447.1 penicillin-binding protein C [Enterococcus haemoperoxidus ATCC BAA-382]EOT61401.1 penicillin-binding protein C [Enterococcus haemoperoxidus ATCC BAA-382]OJG51659.1 penicillin-binding protein C [Enterococcus haemoperoxidus]
MSIKNKIKNFVKKKNLNPMNNRKKVGIILFATSIGLFFLFAFRLTYIVAVGKVAGVSLPEKTANLYQGSKVVKAKRGAILDRNGEVIAEDATSYSVYAILSESYLGEENKKLYAQKKDFQALAEILDRNTELTKDEVLKYLNSGVNEDGSVKFQVEFGIKGKNITLETRQKIEDELKQNKLAGLYFEGHPARIYPNGVFASHFIGYTDSVDAEDDSKGLVGKMGLEESYNDILKGQDGKIEYEKDVYGNPLPGTVASKKEAIDGKDIYTTLDSRIQSRLEVLLDPVVEEFKPEDMTAMLMKAKTGEILAMSQRPSFNPETKEGLGKDTVWRNILVEDKFEPGSTMKLFTAAAAMQEGKFNPNATFAYPAGGYKLDDRTVNDHDFGAVGPLTFRQAISWSSNVGMLTLEQMMGGDKWKEYLEKFGFGKSTNSGLVGESAGELPGDNWVDQAMSSFGQAISVTNFQMMQAYTAIANDGSMLKPQYISKIVDKGTGEEKVTQPEKVGQPVITPQAASDIRTYMIDTVEDPNYGIAYDVYKIPGYHIAAKTGTAQITGDNGYMAGLTDYTYSVVEMVPADNPEYILYLTMKKPQTYTREALAKIANPLMQVVMDSMDSESNATVEPAK